MPVHLKFDWILTLKERDFQLFWILSETNFIYIVIIIISWFIERKALADVKTLINKINRKMALISQN